MSTPAVDAVPSWRCRSRIPTLGRVDSGKAPDGYSAPARAPILTASRSPAPSRPHHDPIHGVRACSRRRKLLPGPYATLVPDTRVPVGRVRSLGAWCQRTDDLARPCPLDGRVVRPLTTDSAGTVGRGSRDVDRPGALDCQPRGPTH